MFNLGSDQPTSSRMNFAPVGVGQNGVGNRHRHVLRRATLSSVSVLTMGLRGGPGM